MKPILDFPGGAVDRSLSVNAGDMGSIPGLGRCPGEGNGNPYLYKKKTEVFVD